MVVLFRILYLSLAKVMSSRLRPVHIAVLIYDPAFRKTFRTQTSFSITRTLVCNYWFIQRWRWFLLQKPNVGEIQYNTSVSISILLSLGPRLIIFRIYTPNDQRTPFALSRGTLCRPILSFQKSFSYRALFYRQRYLQHASFKVEPFLRYRAR